jgi:hypothetical protein
LEADVLAGNVLGIWTGSRRTNNTGGYTPRAVCTIRQDFLLALSSNGIKTVRSDFDSIAPVNGLVRGSFTAYVVIVVFDELGGGAVVLGFV